MRHLTRIAAAMLVGAGFAGFGAVTALAADSADAAADSGGDAEEAAGAKIEPTTDDQASSEIPETLFQVIPFEALPDNSVVPDGGATLEVRLDFGAVDLPEAKGFLIFHDAQSDQSGLGSNVIDDDKLDFGWRTRFAGSFTPRAGLAESTSSGFLAPGEATLLDGFTPRSANAHLSLSFAPGEDDKAHKRLGIELSSSISVQPIELPGGVSRSFAEAMNRQEYNLGVNIGYFGFNLGASFKREYDNFSDGYEGFDVGLGYRGASWSTNLSVGEYRRRDDSLLGMAALPINSGIDRDAEFYAFGFGASYNFSHAFRLSGGFRHFEYGRSYRIDLAGAERAQVFYLGTHLNF